MECDVNGIIRVHCADKIYRITVYHLQNNALQEKAPGFSMV
jgi:hypothetical protein